MYVLYVIYPSQTPETQTRKNEQQQTKKPEKKNRSLTEDETLFKSRNWTIFTEFRIPSKYQAKDDVFEAWMCLVQLVPNDD